jgi:hypothetical protein
MAQDKILIDSSAYFCLARQQQPLLGVELGRDKVFLYIIESLQKELDLPSRLHSPFPWLNAPGCRQNRSMTLTGSSEECLRIAELLETGRRQARNENLAVTPVDAETLAYAQVLELPVVTGDDDVCALGKSLGLTIWPVAEWEAGL